MVRVVLFLLLVVLPVSVVGGVTWAWVAQNSHQTAQLGLDLAAIGAWQMRDPMPVPTLMGASFASGVFAGLFLYGLWSISRRLRSRTPTSDAFASDV